MKLLSVALISLLFAACNGAGDRTDNMNTVQHDSPSSDPNGNNRGPLDTSATHVQDSSTVIGYDTASRK